MMREKTYLDIEKLIPDYPARRGYRERSPGDRHEVAAWDSPRMLATVEAAGGVSVGDNAVVYTGLPPCWAVAAVEHTLAPRESYFVTAYLDDLEVKLRPFPVGEPGSDCDIDFIVVEDGDDLHIRVVADRDSTPETGHNYNYANFDKTVAPPIPEGKNVHIVADGATYIVLCAEKTYAPVSKSVSISFAPDAEYDEDGTAHRIYRCCYTTPGGKILGEVTRMYHEWDTPLPIPPVHWYDEEQG